jgi:hypothetical protein
MLTLGIPSYRLPREIIDEEIAVLRELGVAFKTGVDHGYGHDHRPAARAGIRRLFHGHRLPGVQTAGHRGRRVSKGCGPVWTFCCAPTWVSSIDLGDRVAVIGGGNVAMDSVRTASAQRVQTAVHHLPPQRSGDAGQRR